MRVTLDEILRRNGLMVIDGSMSTALERLGANLNSRLWTAKALAETPELVKQVHLDYFRAGADCGITCSYQATIPGLTENGYTGDEARKLIAKSVSIFLEARDEWWEAEGGQSGRSYPLCLAGIGPYGAYLADGSEYRGRYGIDQAELRAFHQERMEILWNAGADILLIETQPSLQEALIEAEIAEEMGADYWISFSCCDGRHINEGDRIRDCAKILSADHPHLKMIGVNCTKPEYIEELIGELKRGTTLPVAVYPNSGEEYDPITKTWHGQGDSKSFGEYALDYYRCGADAVGGCCTTVDEHVRQVVSARNQYLKEKKNVRIKYAGLN
ncbi:MAG: homocysteine S-methyltransferase [Clostridiales bacterium]|nr:homocysteine S-methyltransferase [Clostridiales bacterium]